MQTGICAPRSAKEKHGDGVYKPVRAMTKKNDFVLIKIWGSQLDRRCQTTNTIRNKSKNECEVSWIAENLVYSEGALSVCE